MAGLHQQHASEEAVTGIDIAAVLEGAANRRRSNTIENLTRYFWCAVAAF